MAKQEQNREEDDAKKSPNKSTDGDEIEVADSDTGTGSNDRSSTEAADTAEESAAFSVLVPDQKDIDVEKGNDENSNPPSSAAATVAAEAQGNDESNDDQKKSTDICDDGNDAKQSATDAADTDKSNSEENAASSLLAPGKKECNAEINDDTTSNPPSSPSKKAPAAAAQGSLKFGNAPADDGIKKSAHISDDVNTLQAKVTCDGGQDDSKKPAAIASGTDNSNSEEKAGCTSAQSNDERDLEKGVENSGLQEKGQPCAPSASASKTATAAVEPGNLANERGVTSGDVAEVAAFDETGQQNVGNTVSNLNIGAYDIVGEVDISAPSATNQAQTNPTNTNGGANQRTLRDIAGAFFIPGPDYVPGNAANYEEYDTNHDPENDVLEAEVNPVIEGYLPMTEKERKKQMKKEIYKRLKANAITLDESAVKKIPEGGSRGEVEEIEKTSPSQEYCGLELESFRKLFCVSLLLLVAVGIVVASVLGTQQNRNNDEGNETDEDSFDYMICGVDISSVGGNVYDRYTIAQEIISEITPIEILENETSPQSRALSWIVCNDTISSDLLNNPDPSGKLPNQTNGFVISGNSGEAQVTRRYALAVLYLSTTENGPWNETGGYLDPELHECSWYRNFTRGNFPFGDFDPMGAVCQGDHDQDFLRDDGERKVERMTINFRVPNNMVGSLPMEFGYLVDVVNIFIESHPDMAGPIPHSIGHMTHLESISILFMGPNFGGPLPESLFQIPALQHLTFTRNEGNWTLPETVEFVETPGLMSVTMFYSGFSGPLPHWLSQSDKLTALELSGNDFSGEIPDSFQNFSSLDYLCLFANRLNSTMPSALGELKSLKALLLGDNNIQGSIPSSIGKLTQLDLLHLGGNDMTSTIPQSFADLSVLKSLVLDSNRFNGTIEVLGSLKEVSTLFIHNNRFSGTIPGSLFSSTPYDNIHADFGNNLFRGVLPSEFGNLQNLTYLAATQNDFDPNSVDERICNNTPFLVMDCSSCSCCSNCCQNSNRYCDFHPNEYVLLGLECSFWYMHCGKPEQAYDVLPTD